MDRKTIAIINSDKEIVELRMQSEDLINNIDILSNEEFEEETSRIKNGIEKRMAELYNKYNNNSNQE